MSLVTYTLVPGASGGTVSYGDRQMFNIGAAITAGGGQFTVDDQAQPQLAEALDKSRAVARSGLAPSAAVVNDRVGPLMGHVGGTGALGDVPVRGPDGLFRGQQVGLGGVVALGNISGAVTCDMSLGSVFAGTLTGDVVVTFTNWPAAPAFAEPLLLFTQNGAGGHQVTVAGVVWLPNGQAPILDLTPGALAKVPLFSPDQGAHLYSDTGQGLVLGGIGFVRAGGSFSGAFATVARITVPAGVTHKAGNTLFMLGMFGFAGSPSVDSIAGVADSKSNPWQLSRFISTGVSGRVVFIAQARLTADLVSGDTITLTRQGSTADAMVLDSAEFCGLSGQLDAASAGSNNTSASTSQSAGALAAGSRAAELALAAYAIAGTTGGSTVAGGWAKGNDITYVGDITRAFAWEWSILTAIGGQTPALGTTNSVASTAIAASYV